VKTSEALQIKDEKIR